MKPARESTDRTGGRPPHTVDAHVGGRIRLRRRALKISQQALGEALGLTFQQVQKYERGANRVSASKLHEIARALKTTVSYFFEGLETSPEGDGEGSGLAASVYSFLMSPEGVELATLMPQLRPRLRRELLRLARVLAEGSDAKSD